MRHGGQIIPSNKSTALPGTCVVVDTETNEGPHPRDKTKRLLTLRLGCATAWRFDDGQQTRRRTLDFTDSDDFWTWLLEVSHPRQPTWLFAHNLSFDLTVLKFWDDIERKLWRFSDDDEPSVAERKTANGKRPWQGFLCDDDPPTILNMKHKCGWRLLALDTLNYWRCSLAKLGKSVGLQKLIMPQSAASDDDWLVYCRRDCDILEAAMLKLCEWWREGEYGKFRYTTPSLAMAAWRHRFMDRKIVRHAVPEVRELERSGYYGGRLELRFRGKADTRCWQLDVNSMYASILRDELFPVELHDHGCGDDRKAASRDNLGLFAVADVCLKTERPIYPLRCRDGTIFPVGEFWTTLSGPELVQALDAGEVDLVGRWASFRLGRPFRSFVDHFWAERQAAAAAGDTAKADLCKNLLTNFYGKWGQRTSRWKHVADLDVHRPWERWGIWNYQQQTRREFRSVGWHLQQLQQPEEHKHNFPAIAAWCTSYARTRINRLCDIAGKRHVYYVVTDAIYTDAWGYGRLKDAGEIDDHALGKLKVVSVGANAEFTALHNYRIGEKRVPEAAKRHTVNGKGACSTFLEFDSLAQIIHGRPLPGVGLRESYRKLNTTYWRGTTGRDGWVVPLRLRAGNVIFQQYLESGERPTLSQILEGQQ